MTQEGVHRPTWQTEPCPPWCVTDHREDDLVADRIHDSHAVTLSAWTPDDTEADAVPRELFIAAYKRNDSTETWVYLGHPDPRAGGITLALDSAARLAGDLAGFAESIRNATHESVD